MAPATPLLLLLLASAAPLWSAPAHALPIVDPGLFVIMGVKTCRAGSGYCLLGNDCTLDEDFLPDDRGGHCDGLRSAFTPSAHFVCCRYSAETNATTEAPVSAASVTSATGVTTVPTVTEATTDVDAATTETDDDDDDAATGTDEGLYDDRFATTEGVEHRATEMSQETTTPVEEIETSTYRGTTKRETEQNETERKEHKTEEDKKNKKKTDVNKRTRIEIEEEQRSTSEEQSFTDTESSTIPTTGLPSTSDYPSTVVADSSNSTTSTPKSVSENTEDGKHHDKNSVSDHTDDSEAEENKNNIDSFTDNGVMMHDVLKLITEGEWQISSKNNEVAEEANSEGSTTEDNYTDSSSTISMSSSDESDTERTTTEEHTTNISHHEHSENTEGNSATSMHSTEAYAPTTQVSKGTSVKSTTSNPKKEESATPLLKIVTTLEKEIIVKDKEGEERSSTDVPLATTEHVRESPSATEGGNATTEVNEARGLCLGDVVNEGDCWLIRFIDSRFDSFLCHGAMIGYDLVLTSADCAISLYQAGTTNVKAAGRSPKPSMDVASIVVHEDFRPQASAQARYDMGLVSVTKRDACLVCVAPASRNLSAEVCYTFAGASQGDGEVKKQQCQHVSVVEQNEQYSVKCTLPKKENLQVHSGAPLVCGNEVAGLAYASDDGPLFTPAAQLLPWVRWNVKKFYARASRYSIRWRRSP